MKLLKKLWSTTPKQKDTSTEQSNVEKTHNSILASEIEKIPNTPFTLIRQENKWFITMGNYRITEPTKTKAEQLKKLETEKWNLIMHITIITQEKTQELQKIAKEQILSTKG